MAVPNTMIYVYSFVVWPAKTYSKSAFSWFDLIKGRVEMEFTKDQFIKFRAEMKSDGLELHEIERYFKPDVETVHD